MTVEKTNTSQTILNYVNEAEWAKKGRMTLNEDNFKCFHLEQDWSHKTKGQSQEFLAKQATAVEQITAFLQQGLVDHGKWFSIEDESGEVLTPEQEREVITCSDMEKLLERQLKKNHFEVFVADMLKLGFLGALMITKTGGINKSYVTGVKAVYSDEEGLESKKVPEVTRKDFWQLDLNLIRQEDFFPDPSGKNLYIVERIEMDKYELIEMAEARPDVFNLENIKNLGTVSDNDQDNKKSQETGQDNTFSNYRKKVVIYEAWGTFLNPTTGEVMHRNANAACTSEGIEIIPPRKNPFWHGEWPYNYAPIIRVPKSVWHKALMDAPTKHNHALNEIYNLMFDSGMMATHGIKQIRMDWLEDPAQVADGIAPGDSLNVNSSCPPGGKVLEQVATSGQTQESMNMFNMTDREFNQSALSNALRLGGMPQRQVKATEIVASNQSVNSIFNGVVKQIESGQMEPSLVKAWKTIAQNIDDMELDEIKSLLGEEKALIIKQKSQAEIYAETVMGKRFKVFGLSTAANKLNDFRKLTALLQTISGSEKLSFEFQKQYSFTKFLGELIKSLDIDTEKIKASTDEIQRAEEERRMQMAIQMQGKTGGQPDLQSQIPQDGGGPESGGLDVPRSDLLTGMTTP